MTDNLSEEQKKEIVRILEAKIKATNWVIENKDPKNPDALKSNVTLQESIVKLLKPEEKNESEPEL